MTTYKTMPNNKIHEGRNVKRFREMLGIKQDALAADLGDDWNQQRVSLLEQKETAGIILLTVALSPRLAKAFLFHRRTRKKIRINNGMAASPHKNAMCSKRNIY